MSFTRGTFFDNDFSDRVPKKPRRNQAYQTPWRQYRVVIDIPNGLKADMTTTATTPIEALEHVLRIVIDTNVWQWKIKTLTVSERMWTNATVIKIGGAIHRYFVDIKQNNTN